MEVSSAHSTLVSRLAYPSHEARNASWDVFRDDPVGKKVVEESHCDGPIVQKMESQSFNTNGLLSDSINRSGKQRVGFYITFVASYWCTALSQGRSGLIQAYG